MLEIAVECGAEAIVAHSGRDFEGVEEAFGIRVEPLRAFLMRLEEEGGTSRVP